MSDKPVLRCLVAYWSNVFGLCSDTKFMSLDEALDYKRVGFAVLVDPADERDLAHWTMIERSLKQRKRFWRLDAET